MLETLRDRNRNFFLQAFIYLMLGGVIVAMAIMFGPGSFGRTSRLTSPDHAAKVNGEIITASEFGSAVENTIAQYRNFGLPVDDARIAGIRRQAIDQLINLELVAQAAARHGVRVPDDELAKEIKDQLVPLWEDHYRDEFPSFRDFYKRYVSSQGLTMGGFEEQMRKRLVYQRMLDALRTNVKVSPEEVERAYREENDKINLEFVRVSPIAFRKGIEPSAEQIQKKLETDMDAVKTWYEENKFRYERPKRVRARHILIKPEGDDDAAREAARKKAEELLARVKAGEDFAKLATEYSMDPGSKDKGGDLNWFGPGVMAKPFEEAAFALGPGEVSDVVETRFGYHIIKVEEVQEATKKSLDEVKEEVAKNLLIDEIAREKAREKAEEILAEARAGKTLEEIAPPPPTEEGKTPAPIPAGQVVASKTGLVPVKDGYIQGIGRNAELAKAALALTPEKPLIDKPFEVSGSYYVVRLIERQKPDMKAFAEQKDKIAERLKRKKEADIERAWLDSLRDAAEVQINESVVHPKV
ncbi:MAG: hypothetical protein D6729_07505 [Deltaproteobacteria bacterium]|nr:MAG: hypothetical protein D6729_07505 [Deltaproteobacteria bacterium]